jgi:signal transduction histidine kinase
VLVPQRGACASAGADGGSQTVSDTGVGIAPEDQETVFEEFRQVGAAAKKVEGTGLGLTLCRKFVELHGGKDMGEERGRGGLDVYLQPSSPKRLKRSARRARR